MLAGNGTSPDPATALNRGSPGKSRARFQGLACWGEIDAAVAMDQTRIDFLLDGHEVSVARVRAGGSYGTGALRITVAGETRDASVKDSKQALEVAKDLVGRATGQHWQRVLTGSMLHDVADVLITVARV
jgi:hypothetical protein